MLIKTTIELVEQSLFQIRSILLNDLMIRKLLYLQIPNAATSETNVTTAQVDNLISIVPFLEDTGGIENSAESNFMVVYAPMIDLSNDVQHVINIAIDIFVYKDYYLLNGSKMRLTQLLNRIVDILDNKKLAFAEKFSITDARLSNLEKGKTIGYLTNWTVTNGTDIQY
jgi:hypothetical protein